MKTKAEFASVLQDHNALLAAIIDSSEDAIISKDLNSIITSWNKAAEQLFGYTAEEMIGRSIRTIIPADRMHEEDMIIAAIQKGEKIDHLETVRQKKDGSHFPISVTVSPVKNDLGQVIGASKIARDISERHALEQRQAMLAAIVDSSEDAIVSKDLNGNIRSWNKAAETIFQYKEEEVIGKNISIIIPNDRLHEETVIIARIKAGLKVDHFETERRRKDGSLVHLSLTISPIRDKYGKIVGASKIARDITEKVGLHRELQRYAEQLEILNKHKDEFIGIASHELRTPLTSIKLYGQLLARGKDPEQQQQNLEKQQMAIVRLERLVGDLLDVSKISSGHLVYQKETFDLNDALNTSIEIAAMNAPSHKIGRTDDISDVPFYGDRIRIEQVLFNLIANAIKYSPNADRVEVTLSRTMNEVKISIRDHGIGMDKEELDRIFDRFYRVQTSSNQFGGLGLGLFIASKIVDAHNGSIDVQSQPGKGSVFIVTLPVQI